MKPRERGFLDPKKLPEEVFDYVRELHDLLWRVARIVNPGASGDLSDMVEDAIGVLEATYAAQSEAEQKSLRYAQIVALAGQHAAKTMCPNLEGDFSAILKHLNDALSRSEEK